MSEHIYGTDGHEGHWLTGEEIVRCRDCSRMEQRVSFDGTVGWFLCTNFDRPTRRDGFCAWGERRDA